MSTAHASIRRRQFLLGALTVLLHVLVLRWFGGQIGRVPDVFAYAAPAPMVAELIETPPPPVPPPVPPPQPAPSALPPLPDIDPEPVQPAPPPAPHNASAAADAAPAAAGDPAAAPRTQAGQAGAAPGPAGARAGQAAVAAAAPPQPAPPAQPVAPPQPAAPAVRRYKVDLPPSADITLAVARTDANGTKWSGEQLLSWTIGPNGYHIRIEAGIRVVFARVNLLTLTSEGKVGDDGFAPVLMTEKRRGRAMTATHFNRADNTLTFSASEAKYGLVPGAQDEASVPLQLAAIARGDAKQLSDKIDIQVGQDRDASIFTFTVAGQETIQTPLGRIDTWHLVRPPKPGSYNSRLELWLAPAYGWYPVQIRNIEASGAVTTQTASKIVTTQAGS